jgi:hypothetical protein
LTLDARSLLMQMLAARAGGGGEGATPLLAALSGDGDSTSEILKNYAALRAPREDDNEAEEYEDMDVSVDPAEPESEPGPRNSASSKPVDQRRYVELLRELSTELQEVRERCDALAAALGACYLCWGTNEQCTECEGAGTPAWTTPDRELFRELVVPSIERLRRARAGFSQRPRPKESSPPNPTEWK